MLIDDLPQASPPTEMGLTGGLSYFFYCSVVLMTNRQNGWFCAAVLLLTGRLLVPCLCWGVTSSDVPMAQWGSNWHQRS